MLEQIFSSFLNSTASNDSGQDVFSFMLFPFLLLIFSVNSKGNFYYSQARRMFILIIFVVLITRMPWYFSVHVFLFTKALLSRRELFHHFRNRKLSPGVSPDVQNYLST